MRMLLLGIAIFFLFMLLAGSKYAYNPPDVQNQFCDATKLCEVQK